MKAAAPETPLRPSLAPLAGYTDRAFRRACRHEGLVRAYTALIDAGALVYGNRENNAILERSDDEPWLGVQLLGARMDFVEPAVRLLSDMAFDELNFNMGCPVRKVVQRQAGAALLKQPALALALVERIRALWRTRPFTVKLRILDNADPAPTIALCKQLEDAGVDGVMIHGRVASSVYSGPVATGIIAAVRESLRIPVTANGGIFTLADAQRLAEETGCRDVMVARGAIGNPWIFRSILTGQDYMPTHEEVCAAMKSQLLDMVSTYGEEGAMINGRKIILGYMSGRGYRRALKTGVCGIKTLAEFEAFLTQLRDQ